jgi:hypothetical protein
VSRDEVVEEGVSPGRARGEAGYHTRPPLSLRSSLDGRLIGRHLMLTIPLLLLRSLHLSSFLGILVLDKIAIAKKTTS